jgi:hypothetical protein
MLFKTNRYALTWNMDNTLVGIFHAQIMIFVTNYFLYERIFWCCSSVNSCFCVNDTFAARGWSVSKINTLRPVRVQYQHTIILCYHGQNEVLSAAKLGTENYPAARGRGHICRVRRICISGNQCMHVTGSCMFRYTVTISKIMSSNEVPLLAVGTRGVMVQQIKQR